MAESDNWADPTTMVACPQRQEIESIAVSPGGTRLAAGTRDSRIRVFDVDTAKLLRQARIPGGTGGLSWVTGLSFTDEQQVVIAARGRIHLFDLGTGAVRGLFDRPTLFGFDQAAGWMAVGGALSLANLGDPSQVRSVGAADHAHFDRVALAPSGDYVAGVWVVRDGYDYIGEELRLYATATMERVLTVDLGPEQCYLAHNTQVTAALGFVSDAVALVRVEPGCLTFDEVDQKYRQIACPEHPPPPGPASVRFLGLDGSTRRGHWPDGFRPRHVAFTPDAVYGLAHGRLVRMDAQTLASTNLAGSAYETAQELAVCRAGTVAAVRHNGITVTLFRRR